MNHDWLDKHIEEQAKHYGLTPAQHNKLLRDAATYQEKIEKGIVEEPDHKLLQHNRPADLYCRV